jgi:glutamate---cysteine ligase / carboxylate-amine ligase
MSQLTPAADVLDHRFGTGAPFTVGIEEEYMLLDPRSFDLAPGAESILRSEADGRFAECISPELFTSLVEFHTPVCADLPEAGRQLRALRRHAAELVDAHGLRLGSAGTHPFALFEQQRITPRERYLAIIDQLQYAGRRELIYGLHVHVAVDDPDRAIRVVNGLRAHLCELVALSANAPFWRGEPTGFATCRHLMFAAFPRSGPPPHFRSYAEYSDVVARLVAARVIEDYTRIWWDVRPHPRFGTVEVRVMDAVTDVEDAIALAAYVHALVHRHAVGRPAAPCHPVLASESKWLAARYGLDAKVVGGPVRQLVERTLSELADHARELGCDRELEGIGRLLRDGNGATRQLRAYAGGEIAAVARAIADASRPVRAA